MRWLGQERVELDRCESTMSEADARARAGAAHGTVIIAREQTSGRGRRGRQWHSAAGAGLAMSVVLRPRLSPEEVPPVTLATGLAVCETVNSLGARASLKWPNDVVAGGRKMAGILTEMSTRQRALEHVVVGIGLNVGAVPQGLEAIATSLARESGRNLSVAELTDALLPQLERCFDQFFEGGTAAVVPSVRERIVWGRRVAVERSPGCMLSGRAVDLDASGALIVEDDTGARHLIVAGEVQWGGPG